MFINNVKNKCCKETVNVVVENIGGGGSGNLRKIVHIIDPEYTIVILPVELIVYSSILYIADVQTNIQLPSLNDNILNVQLEIINNSDGNVNLNTVNGELMFNSLNISLSGSTTFMLTINKFCKIISRKRGNLFSWILLTS